MAALDRVFEDADILEMICSVLFRFLLMTDLHPWSKAESTSSGPGPVSGDQVTFNMEGHSSRNPPSATGTPETVYMRGFRDDGATALTLVGLRGRRRAFWRGSIQSPSDVLEVKGGAVRTPRRLRRRQSPAVAEGEASRYKM